MLDEMIYKYIHNKMSYEDEMAFIAECLDDPHALILLLAQINKKKSLTKKKHLLLKPSPHSTKN